MKRIILVLVAVLSASQPAIAIDCYNYSDASLESMPWTTLREMMKECNALGTATWNTTARSSGIISQQQIERGKSAAKQYFINAEQIRIIFERKYSQFERDHGMRQTYGTVLADKPTNVYRKVDKSGTMVFTDTP